MLYFYGLYSCNLMTVHQNFGALHKQGRVSLVRRQLIRKLDRKLKAVMYTFYNSSISNAFQNNVVL
jgi:hypothetical protein